MWRVVLNDWISEGEIGPVTNRVIHTHSLPTPHQPQPHQQIQSLKAESNQAADQSISLVRLVRAFAAEEVEKRRFDERTLTSVAAELRVKMLYAVIRGSEEGVWVGWLSCAQRPPIILDIRY